MDAFYLIIICVLLVGFGAAFWINSCGDVLGWLICTQICRN